MLSGRIWRPCRARLRGPGGKFRGSGGEPFARLCRRRARRKYCRWRRRDELWRQWLSHGCPLRGMGGLVPSGKSAQSAAEGLSFAGDNRARDPLRGGAAGHDDVSHDEWRGGGVALARKCLDAVGVYSLWKLWPVSGPHGAANWRMSAATMMIRIRGILSTAILRT